MGCADDFVAAIIVAGGKGERLRAATPKQYLKIGDRSVLGHTLGLFASIDEIDQLVVVVPGGDVRFVRDKLVPSELGHNPKGAALCVVGGGATRQESVRAGLEAVGHKNGVVLVHDAVRPFVQPCQIRQVIEDARKYGAAILAVPIKDTVKHCYEGFVRRTVPREALWAAQTPQAFHADKLHHAHEFGLANGIEATDDAALFEELGFEVFVTQGSYLNIKITTEEDLTLAKVITQS